MGSLNFEARHVAVLGFGILALAACGRLQTRYDAPPHAIPAISQGLDPGALARKVREAGRLQSWTVDSQIDRSFRMTKRFRTHSLTVDVTFGGDRYTITHVSSTNLKESGTTIHRAYNDAVQGLEQAVDQQLSLP